MPSTPELGSGSDSADHASDAAASDDEVDEPDPIVARAKKPRSVEFTAASCRGQRERRAPSRLGNA